MVRKFALSLLIVSIALAAVADKKKGKGSSTSTTTVATSTTQIQASEGSTAMAIRGIVEPGDGAAVIGFKDGVVFARDRVTGRTFKFNGAFAAVGDSVNADIAKAAMANARPCCIVATINGNLVTVNEPALARSFELKFTASPPDEMRVGSAVNANFKTRVASIGSWSGPITNLSAATALRP